MLGGGKTSINHHVKSRITQTCKQEYASAEKVLVDKSLDLIHEPFYAICLVLRRRRPRSGAVSGAAVCTYMC